MSWSLHIKTKTCTGPCGQDLPTDAFYKHSGTKDGLRPKCKKCMRAESAARNKANPEGGRRASREWYRRNRESASTRSLQYRHEHLEERRAYDKRYAESNPEKVREKSSRRRAQKRTTQVEVVDLKKILEEHGATCHICQQPIDPDLAWPDRMSLSFDHVVALANGGSHTFDNLLPSHLLCNMKKGATT